MFNHIGICARRIKKQKVDLCVVLGDLLTYGTDPNEVIKLLQDYSKDVECVFIIGNHDQFYFDLHDGLDPFNYKMPSFVKESILWTKEILDFDLKNIFDWKNKYILNDIFFAHANPFDFKDWTYINDDMTLFKAGNELFKNNFKMGVFGHTHRTMHKIIFDNLTKISEGKVNLFEDYKAVHIINSGSIGQPRGEGLNYLIIDMEKVRCNIKMINLDRFKISISQKLDSTPLSLKTKKAF